VVQALCLHTTFRSLNEGEEWRREISRGPASAATNIVQHAVLRELILILVRVFDKPRAKLETSDKVSFAVVSMWLERGDIREALAARARVWFPDGYRADENEAAVRDAIQRLHDGLHRLEIENPNRNRRLRDFRDQFLAHELHLEVPRDPPLFGHIAEIGQEIKGLSEAAALAIEGSSTAWNFVDDQMRDSADALWRSVALGGPARAASSGSIPGGVNIPD
jgi:hypothetical protein